MSSDKPSLPEYALVEVLKRLSLTVSTAESCTGGLIAKRLTDVAGVSSVFPGGIVSYCDRVKADFLGVPEAVLERFTAVSAECACAMARGICQRMHTDFGIASTGYAGPGDEDTGLVFIAVACGEIATAKELHLEGDREQIRTAAASEALSLLLSMLNQI
jgi:PncC family amidohydrolase